MTQEDNLVRLGFSSNDGICFKADGAILKGEKLTEEDMNKITYAKTCSETNNAEQLKECLEELKDVITLNKRPDEEETRIGKLYNYSPLVETFILKDILKIICGI